MNNKTTSHSSMSWHTGLKAIHFLNLIESTKLFYESEKNNAPHLILATARQVSICIFRLRALVFCFSIRPHKFV